VATLVAFLVLAGLLVGLSQTDNQATLASTPVEAPPPATPDLIVQAIATDRLSPDEGWVELAEAIYAPAAVGAPFKSTTAWSGTHVLLAMHEALEAPTSSAPGIRDGFPTAMSAATKARIEAMRAGSRLQAADGAARDCDGFASVAPDTRQSARFHIDYNPAQLSGLNIDAFVTSLEAAYNTEVATFGWPAPVFKGAAVTPSIGNRIHVRLEPLAGGLLGFASTRGSHANVVGDNPATTDVTETEADAACIVLDSDFAEFRLPPQQMLDSTTSHEFNHALQFGLGALRETRRPDLAFTEALSVYMEDEVFDAANLGTTRSWPRFTDSLGNSGSEASDPNVYNLWVVFRALFERDGTTTAAGGQQRAREFWRAIAKQGVAGRSDGKAMLAALSEAVAARSGANLGPAYHAAAVALRFSKACGGGLAYPHCLEEGPQWIATKGPTPTQATVSSVGAAAVTGTVKDDYALNYVALPVGASYSLTLRNTATGGMLRSSAICETTGGLRIREFPQVAGAGATSTLTGFDANGCARASAVITNEANTEPNPATSAGRSYELTTVAAAADTTTPTSPTSTTPPSTTPGPGGPTSPPTTVCPPAPVTPTAGGDNCPNPPPTTICVTTTTTIAATTTTTTTVPPVTPPAGAAVVGFESHNNPCPPPGGGNDRVECHGERATLVGTDGPDSLVGTSGRDVIHARGGADAIDGGGGDDVICGGSGNDRIRAGDGDDEVFGGDGNDRIFGGDGDDELHGGPGRDVLFGGDGNDDVRGGDGDDGIGGGRGQDSLFGEAGFDRLTGGSDSDIFRGGPDPDTLADASSGARGVGSQGGG